MTTNTIINFYSASDLELWKHTWFNKRCKLCKTNKFLPFSKVGFCEHGKSLVYKTATLEVPLYIKNENWLKLVKSMAMKIAETMIRTYNSTECSIESFESVILT